MKEKRTIMAMPVVIEVNDLNVTVGDFEEIFSFLRGIDDRFSVYKKDSEISKYNDGEITENDLSNEMREVLNLSQQTKEETNGFFDIVHNGRIDPSGIVKGLAIYKAAEIIKKKGFKNFYVEIAGDIEIAGLNNENKKWAIGIRNPFNRAENVKIVYLTDCGIATSGTYENGEHIYIPGQEKKANEIISLTVIGPNVYEADRFATACFAMGKKGINFLEQLSGFEGYMVDHEGISTFTSNFEKYTKQ